MFANRTRTTCGFVAAMTGNEKKVDEKQLQETKCNTKIPTSFTAGSHNIAPLIPQELYVQS